MFKKLFAIYKGLYDEVFYTKQLSALYSWIQTKQGGEEWVVSLNLPRQQETVLITAGKAIEISHKEKSDSVRIIICQSGKMQDSLKNSKVSKSGIADWYPLFTSRDLEIWENKNRPEITPLRFGLNAEERKTALVIARQAVTRFLKNEKQDFMAEDAVVTNPRFGERATTCVALWIDGNLRGSQIEKNVPLHLAVARGGARACRDSRFKPVIMEELTKVRIEITLISDLQIPITKNAITEDVIEPAAGYVIESSGKIGWYLPEAFNCKRFRTLSEFIRSLSVEKAEICTTDSVAGVSTFRVEDFMETADCSGCLEMDGPVVRRTLLNGVEGSNLRDALISMGTEAARQLLAIQEQDGNIPPVLNPLTGEKKQIDWIKLSCALWSMALFGKTAGKKEFLAGAENGFEYVSTFLYGHPALPLSTKVASLVYLGRLAKVLDKKEDLKKITVSLLEYIEKLTTYEPILYANIASFLAEHAGDDADMVTKAIRYAERVEMDYVQQSESALPFQLARYPELAIAFLYIGEETGEKKYAEKAGNILSWLAKQQLESGAFPIRTFGPPSPYSRGTGKIFEVLSSRYEDNKVVILKALAWLSNMQYDEDNLHFVKRELRDMVRGGLRHDYLNQEVWIDGTAHLLVGLSRLLHIVDN